MVDLNNFSRLIITSYWIIKTTFTGIIIVLENISTIRIHSIVSRLQRHLWLTRDISPGVLFILLGDLNAVLELHATLVEQQPLECAGIAIRGIKIRSFFNQHFAHLCVHRRIFRLIEGFFENLEYKKQKNYKTLSYW